VFILSIDVVKLPKSSFLWKKTIPVMVALSVFPHSWGLKKLPSGKSPNLPDADAFLTKPPLAHHHIC
jgi:hypothetical protein